jgi:5-deoxy-5-amino-3-dehydroquinate synthase
VPRVHLALGDRSYDVVVDHGAISELPALLPTRAKRIAVVTQERVPFDITTYLANAGCEYKVFTIGNGEEHKTLETVGALCRGFAGWGMNRADAVVAVGGGMVTDVAGFAAATYTRGIGVVHVPTTLLGMVDAAIGGKTGVNLPEGKNLVGAFWQPAAVVCDLDSLATLPERERRCGFGEMAKYHFLTGDDLLDMPLPERVARCVAIKAGFVSTDERESISSDNLRGRALLNYGHTLGHALEITTEHRLMHGEAVAIGLIFAARLARTLGRIDEDRVLEHERVVRAYGLDTTLPFGTSPDDVVTLMGRDKKAIDGLTFVLDGPTGIEVVPGVPVDEVRAALAAMA